MASRRTVVSYSSSDVDNNNILVTDRHVSTLTLRHYSCSVDYNCRKVGLEEMEGKVEVGDDPDGRQQAATDPFTRLISSSSVPASERSSPACVSAADRDERRVGG